MFRKVLFWTHLVSALVTGIVIFIMSFTGAALALQPQMLLWAEREARRVEPAGERLAPATLLARVAEQRPAMTVTGLTVEHDASQAATVTMTEPRTAGGGEGAERRPGGAGGPGGPGGGNAPQTSFWVNPYTGAITGQLDQTTFARGFFRVNTDWHRWLAMNGERRNTGRWITGVSNAAFLLLALTGIYIWFPKVWTRPAFRAVSWFRTGLSGKARDFNWHNVIGIWSVPVLVVLTFSAMCISFPKTYDVIYAVTGIDRPPAPAGAGGGQGGPGGGPGGSGAAGRRPAAPAPPIDTLPVDRAWSLAEAQLPAWRSIALRLPQQAGQPLTFTMNDRERLNPMGRSTLTVNAASGEVVRWEPYESLMLGQRLRTWMRFGHTGELWGLPGQIIAGIASAGGCVLVYTGVVLAWRRFIAWRARHARAALRPDLREQAA